MCFHPLTMICSRPAAVVTRGVDQVETSWRGVRQSSRPSRASNTARNCSLSVSHCTTTLPACNTGELANPHCKLGASYGPPRSLPRSFCQRRCPSMSKQNNPSEPNRATILVPSVAGVELQCVALVCRSTRGTASNPSLSQRILPEDFSRQRRVHWCGSFSEYDAPSP